MVKEMESFLNFVLMIEDIVNNEKIFHEGLVGLKIVSLIL